MGHYVTYMVFDKNTSEKEMYAERNLCIIDNGAHDCGVLMSSDSGFKLHSGIICDSYEDAVDYIEDQLCHRRYDDHGVLFRDYSKVKPTKAMENLKEQMKAARDKKEDFIRSHQPNRVKAEFIGCPHCGSKIAKKYLNGVRCPVCRADMRPKSTLERIDGYDKKIRDLEKRYKEAEKKMASKAALKWCVKLEFHV